MSIFNPLRWFSSQPQGLENAEEVAQYDSEPSQPADCSTEESEQERHVDDQIQDELRAIAPEHQVEHFGAESHANRASPSRPRIPYEILPPKRSISKTLPSIRKDRNSTQSRIATDAAEERQMRLGNEQRRVTPSRRRRDIYEMSVSEEDEVKQLPKAMANMSQKEKARSSVPSFEQPRGKNGQFSTRLTEDKSKRNHLTTKNYRPSDLRDRTAMLPASPKFTRSQLQAMDDIGSDPVAHGSRTINSTTQETINGSQPSSPIGLADISTSREVRSLNAQGSDKMHRFVEDDDEDSAALLNQHLRTSTPKRIIVNDYSLLRTDTPEDHLLSASEANSRSMPKQKRGIGKDLEWLQQHLGHLTSPRRSSSQNDVEDSVSQAARNDLEFELSAKAKGKRMASSEAMTEAPRKKSKKAKSLGKGNQNIKQLFKNMGSTIYASSSARSASNPPGNDTPASLDSSVLNTPGTTPSVAKDTSSTHPLVVIPSQNDRYHPQITLRRQSGPETSSLEVIDTPASPLASVLRETALFEASEVDQRSKGVHSVRLDGKHHFRAQDNHAPLLNVGSDKSPTQDKWSSLARLRRDRRHLDTGTPNDKVSNMIPSAESRQDFVKTPLRSTAPPTPPSALVSTKKRTQKEDTELGAVHEAIDTYRTNHDITQFEVNALIHLPIGSTNKKLWQQIFESQPESSRSSTTRRVRRKFHNFEARGTWTAVQDDELRLAYEQYPKQWVKIGQNLNRFSEDCRDRWRNYVSMGEKHRLEPWSLEEEAKFRGLVVDALGAIRSLRRHDKALRDSKKSDIELVDFQAISHKMEQTRSRLQCAQKYKQLMEREASDKDGSESPQPFCGASWRLKKASQMVKSMTTLEKLELLYSIQASGAARESKIPWRTLHVTDPRYQGMGLARKICFRHLKINVRGHEDMKLQEIVNELIQAFEDAAPNEPDLADFDLSSFEEAQDLSQLSTTSNQLTRNSKSFRRGSPVSPRSAGRSRYGRVALKELQTPSQQSIKTMFANPIGFSSDGRQAVRTSKQRNASSKPKMKAGSGSSMNKSHNRQEQSVPAAWHSSSSENEYEQFHLEDDRMEETSESPEHGGLFVTPNKAERFRRMRNNTNDDLEAVQAQQSQSDAIVDSDVPEEAEAENDLMDIDDDFQAQALNENVLIPPYADPGSSESEGSVDHDDFARHSNQNNSQLTDRKDLDGPRSESASISNSNAESSKDYVEDDDSISKRTPINGDELDNDSESSQEQVNSNMDTEPVLDTLVRSSFYGSEDELESMHDDYDVAEAERRYQEELDADISSQRGFYYEAKVNDDGSQLSEGKRLRLSYGTDSLQSRRQHQLPNDDRSGDEEASSVDYHVLMNTLEDNHFQAEKRYLSEGDFLQDTESEGKGSEERQRPGSTAKPWLGHVIATATSDKSFNEKDTTNQSRSQFFQSQTHDPQAEVSVPIWADEDEDIQAKDNEDQTLVSHPPDIVRSQDQPSRIHTTPRFQAINSSHSTPCSPVRLSGQGVNSDQTRDLTISPKICDTKYVHSSDSESSDCEAEIPSELPRPHPLHFEPEMLEVESPKPMRQAKPKRRRTRRRAGQKGQTPRANDGVSESKAKKKNSKRKAKKLVSKLQSLRSPEL